LASWKSINPLYSCQVLGLFYSIQLTIYKYRLYKDPNYVPPKCKCTNKPSVDILKVLNSEQSTLLYIPNSIFGIGFYSLLAILTHYQSSLIYNLIIVSCFGGLYLAYTMIFTINSLCSICVNVHAINLAMLYFATFGQLFK
jgi:uncharacterized membrane protein